MRYPFTHRTKRIVFLFVLLPTATLAYITVPRGDVRLPAENLRARTQDITIAASAPLVPRGRFLDPPPAYVSQSAAVRTPADEAAIEELALTTATPLDATAHLPTQYAPSGSSSAGAVETPSRGSGRSRHSGSGSTAYPFMLARGMEGAASGVSGNAKPAAATGTGATHTTAATDPAPVTITTAALTSSSTPVATSTAQAATHQTSNAGSATSASPAATPAVVATAQNSVASTEHALADAVVAQVASGPVAAAVVTGSAGHDSTVVASGGAPVTPGVSAAEHPSAPSSTPEPLTLLLTASGLACAYGARRYVR